MAASLVPLLSPVIGVPNCRAERREGKETRGIHEARSVRRGNLRAVRPKRLGHGRVLEPEMATTRAPKAKFAAGASSASTPASTSPAREAAERQKEAAEMVQEFYASINRREIASIGDLFSDDCVYEDLVFPKPFNGRKAILEFFQKFMDSVGSELEFRVDDITTGDPNAAGVIWHLDWNGKPLPFSKGCSFYRCEVLNGKRQFVYGRDAVEPATKPGDLTLVALKGLSALLRRFPSLANRF